MGPLALITGAISIADTLGLDEWFGDLVGGKPGAKVASQVIDMAKVVTGADTPEAALEELKANQVMAQELKMQLLSNEHDLKLAALEDLKSARNMYQATDHKTADQIAMKVINENPKLILLLVLSNLCVVLWIDNPTIAVALGNVVGASITYLWQERQSVIAFFFGSSQGSKQKTYQLQDMTKVKS